MAVTGILGKKIGMTQVFDEKGDVHPITVLQAGPCVITQLKTLARDGYEAAQIGLVEFVKDKNVTKPQAGHFAKTEAPPVKVIKEVALELDADGVVATKAGDRVLVDIFSEARFVDVIGTSKGRGFAGVVRRHQFRRRTQVAWTYVPGAGLDWRIQLSLARFSRPAHARPHGRRAGDGAQSAHSRHRPGRESADGRGRGARISREGYVLISKAKAPPRERRGFAGAGTVDPLKAVEEGQAKKK